jgi:3-(3-hydroxy-phenyl)propionate hydroxylase
VARTEWIVARSTSVDVPFVVGTDGHRSGVRRALGLDFREVAPAQHYAVFEFRSNFDLDHEMRIVLGAQTTDVLWPLPGDHCRWSFQLSDFAAPERTRVKDRLAIHLGGTPYPVLAEEGLRHLIAQRAPWFTGSIDEVTWRIVVRFEHRLSDGFGRGRVWLAGDAAHMTGPVGMQSMNVGLFEAHDLAGILARILRQRSTADELAAYERRWMGVWRQLLGLEGGLRPQPQADPWASRCADRLLACLPAHGAELTAMAAQLRLQG